MTEILAGWTRRRFLFDVLLLGGSLATAAVYISMKKAHAGSEEGGLDFQEFSHIKTEDDYYRSTGRFAGYPIADYDAELPARTDVAYRFLTDWDPEDKLIPGLKDFLSKPESAEAEAIVIGPWHGEEHDKSPEEVVTLLAESRAKLPSLKAIWVGDISSEENEMSWINQADLSPLLQAFPKLELLRSRGGIDLALSNPSHGHLRALIAETGGMSKSFVGQVTSSHFPDLEYLELWLGTDEYGCNVEVADLEPILSGKLFPKLRYLGFRNYYQVDDLAAALVGSPILSRLETLDLSLGILSDRGGEALLGLKDTGLQELNLHYNYLSPAMKSRLKELPFQVELSNPTQMESDPEYRFVAVGE